MKQAVASGSGQLLKMISGAHVLVYSKNAEGFESVDAGQGWLIFALPPAEAAFPGERMVSTNSISCATI